MSRFALPRWADHPALRELGLVFLVRDLVLVVLALCSLMGGVLAERGTLSIVAIVLGVLGLGGVIASAISRGGVRKHAAPLHERGDVQLNRSDDWVRTVTVEQGIDELLQEGYRYYNELQDRSGYASRVQAQKAISWFVLAPGFVNWKLEGRAVEFLDAAEFGQRMDLRQERHKASDIAAMLEGGCRFLA